MSIKTLFENQDLYTVECGNCLDVLKNIPDNSVHCVITSPPYFQLRSYADNPVAWSAINYIPMIGASSMSIGATTCSHGLENLPEEYIGHEVMIWSEIRRVLRNDGVAWLNMDDTYAKRKIIPNPYFNFDSAIQPKNLIGIPWRLAFALQASGWNLRNDNIWLKRKCAPESVQDRCTRNHEYIFQLTKADQYFFDMEAILESCASNASDLKKMIEKKERIGGKHKVLHDSLSKASSATNIGQKRAVGNPIGKNHRTVWDIPPKPNKHKHLAAFPSKLVEVALKASVSSGGCCSKCGNQYKRIVDKNFVPTLEAVLSGVKLDRTKQFIATCSCDALKAKPIVLDPFCGSGTTGLVALQNGAKFIGIDANLDYVKLSLDEIGELLR